MLTMKQLYSSSRKCELFEKSDVLGTSINDLAYIESLSYEPSTLNHVILTSHATWAKRSTLWDNELAAAEQGTPVKNRERAERRLSFRRGRRNDDDAGAQVDEETLNTVHSFCRGVFDMVVAGEAQKLKSQLTVSHRAVHDLHENAKNEAVKEAVEKAKADATRTHQRELETERKGPRILQLQPVRKLRLSATRTMFC